MTINSRWWLNNTAEISRQTLNWPLLYTLTAQITAIIISCIMTRRRTYPTECKRNHPPSPLDHASEVEELKPNHKNSFSRNHNPNDHYCNHQVSDSSRLKHRGQRATRTILVIIRPSGVEGVYKWKERASLPIGDTSITTVIIIILIICFLHSEKNQHSFSIGVTITSHATTSTMQQRSSLSSAAAASWLHDRCRDGGCGATEEKRGRLLAGRCLKRLHFIPL